VYDVAPLLNLDGPNVIIGDIILRSYLQLGKHGKTISIKLSTPSKKSKARAYIEPSSMARKSEINAWLPVGPVTSIA
jgi:hypothetical protein